MNISVIFFVCGGILVKDEEVLEVFNKDRGIRFSFSDFMSENHLKTLIQLGHSIGNHFHSHTYLDEDNLARELLNSILALHH